LHEGKLRITRKAPDLIYERLTEADEWQQFGEVGARATSPRELR
jgi:hypothetical protein